MKYLALLFMVAVLALGACKTAKQSGVEQNAVADVDSALSTRLTPQFPADYYIDQGVKYFLTMESSVPIKVRPEYSDLVIRWEWHPWLLLTGFRRRNLPVSAVQLFRACCPLL